MKTTLTVLALSVFAGACQASKQNDQDPTTVAALIGLISRGGLLGGSPNSICQPTLQGGALQGCPLDLQGIVSTMAGPTPGSNTAGDTDGNGNSARFYGPNALTTDGKSLFLADYANNKIRKIVIATGVVTTLAGPSQGSSASGDADGPGPAARFSSPEGLTTDGTYLYVADTMNHKIRRIVIATGVVTTLAGPAQGSTASGDTDGTGNASRFFNPNGITTDGTNLYVADLSNNKIRKIIIATQVVTTLAGPAQGSTASGDTDATGNASRFFSPIGITTDGTNLFVADMSNNKIRKIVIATRLVTTFAGPSQASTASGDTDAVASSARFTLPQGITTDGLNLYVGDTGNNKVRKIEIGSASVSTIAGPSQGSTSIGDSDGSGNAARFFAPVGLSTDGHNLFIPDCSNNKVRRIR